MKETLGADESAAFLNALSLDAVKSLRINPLKRYGDNAGKEEIKELFSLEEVPWSKNGYYYSGAPGKSPYHEAGAYYIQEASAMTPAMWLDIRPGLRMLDLCAAPGGKSTEIASLMENSGFLLSNEINRERAQILSLNIERSAIINTLVTNETPYKLSSLFQSFFDRILVDAPCSGEGMFRKDPESISEWSPENVKMCAARQKEILGEAVKMLSPGGILVYSTCTFSKEENEEQVISFLNENPDFCLLDPECIKNLPEGLEKTRIICRDPERSGFGVRIWPHKCRGEGHFFVVLKRDGDTASNKIRPVNTGKLPLVSDSIKRLFSDFKNEFLPGLTMPPGSIFPFGEQLYLSPPMMPGLTGLKVLRPGLHLGTIRNKRFIPSHSLALFLSPKEAALTADLNSEDARKYLCGETLLSDIIKISDKKGWCLMCYRGFSLGWGKSDGRLIKNHYPKGLRKHF